MEDSDDEQAADNYTFSPRFSTSRNEVDQRENYPLLENGPNHGVEGNYCFNTSGSRSKIRLDFPLVDHTLAINPAFVDLDKSRVRLSKTEPEHRSLEKPMVPVPGPLIVSNTNQTNVDISVELHHLDLGTDTIVTPLLSTVGPITAGVNCAAETTASFQFDLAAYSIIGVGSWIEYDTHDLQAWDIEVLEEVCSTEDQSKGLENQKQHTTFTTCHGNSAAGSTPQKDSGAGSSNSGSGGTNQIPPNGGRHHKHPSDGSNGAGEDDDPTQSKKAKTDNGTHRRFVCPFYIHDPTYFRTSFDHGQRYTLCATGMGFADIARLK